jgi:methylmalonyl-CoA mutase cobalamin-binding domain/chain
MSTFDVPENSVRVLTAASLFDGHDAAINVMRRILQSQGAEVIHLGHNRSVDEVVKAAVEEDVAAVAASSYQGGHVEYFEYLVQRLAEEGAENVRVYGVEAVSSSPRRSIDSPAAGFESSLPRTDSAWAWQRWSTRSSPNATHKPSR